eukprot:162974_1
MAVILYFAVYLNIIYVKSTTFNCSTEWECASQNLQCEDGEHCNIYCMQIRSCAYTTFTCPKPTAATINVSCNIICGNKTNPRPRVNVEPCYYTTVNGYYSNLLSLTVFRPSTNMHVTCPCEGMCNIGCYADPPRINICKVMTVEAEKSVLNMVSTGDIAWYEATINAQYATRLSMFGNGSQTFNSASIYCPPSMNETENEKKCHLHYNGTYRGFFLAKVYAINSFRDLDILCDGPQGFSPYQCWYGSGTYQNPDMYCLSDYSESCIMVSNDGINWDCTDSTATCTVTQINEEFIGSQTYECESPTESPTQSPTQSPTRSPNIASVAKNDDLSWVISLSIIIPFFVAFIIVAVGCWKKRHKKELEGLGEITEKRNYQSFVKSLDDSLPASLQLEGK